MFKEAGSHNEGQIVFVVIYLVSATLAHGLTFCRTLAGLRMQINVLSFRTVCILFIEVERELSKK